MGSLRCLLSKCCWSRQSDINDGIPLECQTTCRRRIETRPVLRTSSTLMDANHHSLQEYFGKSIGTVKKVEISYGPGGVSRGIATIIFAQADAASKAFQELNGILIDQRPIKVEVVVSTADQIPAPRTLSQRITHNQPKAQPKSAASDKRGAKTGANGAAADGAKGTKKAAANPRRAKNARPTKKTAEELDSEMADYFQGGESNGAEGTNTAAPVAAANGDAAMEEDIL
ncbi:hypothetical protein, variant [Gaeumannomyces tritici R3-111a-1]|uniref:RRM domain-containing protein n=1 Tax=Gaeumannomyces tritici (strain R3-111a-1) TaxID=644352 RepID=J3PBG8_GAET3|nr:hypothetical protein, variant [Gaeumannomyces tritici R3-111a-1]EJT71584.1 hypothetical protein, variant [Gaeumannomyces tritici R3-111a-1]